MKFNTVLKYVKSVLDGFWDLLYPPKCVFCAALMEVRRDKIYICESCRKTVRFCANLHCCAVCGAPMVSSEYKYCASCYNKRKNGFPIYFERIVGVFEYNDDSKQGILALKNAQRLDAYDTYSVLLHGMLLSKLGGVNFDMIVTVPPSRQRMNGIGFDQCVRLAEKLEKLTGVKYVKGCMKRNRETLPQKSLNLGQRMTSISGAFSLRVPGDTVRNKTVLVIDDIATTGSTVNECARVLKEAGARAVYGGVIAITPAPSAVRTGSDSNRYAAVK
ncbi:MAG TPA: hypothetical protein H9900_04590 [Candidatus Monoglobus merdigallinarum]|uniref:ComF family protein n=1 Tax=Candidatus Monoglobus merdigallinarum TaxID=2838698 RepID=A0A9D1TM08_9FIRM|nr:hypothetical protein [Candidatus Monoglobus merdigallinarum]